MSQRNLDYIGMDQWRARCPDVEAIAGAGWKVEARCPTCGGAKAVDLFRVARLRGRRANLWNRTQRCPTPGCGGKVGFWVKITGLPHFKPMIAGQFKERETLGERAVRLRAEGIAEDEALQALAGVSTPPKSTG